MPLFTTAQQAISHVKDGDHVWSNAFLALANPAQLTIALGEIYHSTGHPNNLTFCTTAGYSNWEKNSPMEEFVRAGAVKSVVLGHYSSTPDTAKMVMDGQIEGYNLPTGVMTKMVRAAAAGETYFITDIGRNLFVDPAYAEYRLNSRSTEEYVTDIVIDGKRRLKYRIPDMDVALIKGSSASEDGDISFEQEATVSDALSLAQAVKNRGGIVIVQVQRILSETQRPWNVILPAPLVDYIAVCPEQTQILGMDEYQPAMAGDVSYTPEQVRELVLRSEQDGAKPDLARTIIARRAMRQLNKGDIVNIGVGIPEHVAIEAAKSGLLSDISLTVESGAVNGVPVSGMAFGAAQGAHSIYNMAQQFDFYDGGGLDICFIGALEIDASGNVNAHHSPNKLAGIGGFANITQSTGKVVFCATFTAGGLELSQQDGMLNVSNEGRYAKFVNKVKSISFSSKNALETGQQVLYVTERCVFRLGSEGLELIEVYPGIDVKRDVLDQLPFEVTVIL